MFTAPDRRVLNLLLKVACVLLLAAVAMRAASPRSLLAAARADQPLYLPNVVRPQPTPAPPPPFRPGQNTVVGYVQKGPFVQGTELVLRELDNSLNPTGRTFAATIDSNTGSFTVRGALDYPFVELSANGYYFNEIAGALSAAQISLQALVDLRDNTTVNVNILTHLERSRVLYLIDDGRSFAQAKAQAQREILGAFNIPSSAIGGSETLDISQDGQGNAILLAISATLQSNKSEGQLTELLARISSDLREDGNLDNDQLQQALRDGMEYLKPRRAAIRANILARYAELGLVAAVPPFEAYAFRLDHVQPTLISTRPTDGSRMNLTKAVVTFSELMDHTSLNAATIRLTGADGDAIAGTIAASDANTSTTAVFTPTAPMLAGVYTLTVATTVRDYGGNGLSADTVVRFTHNPPTSDGMLLVPAGNYQMGCDYVHDAKCADWESPRHTVYLDAYYIDMYEVTNARYKACVDAGACAAPDPTSSRTRPNYYGNPAYSDYPVLGRSWDQATTFCAWEGKRLPTEAEWEKAARGSSDTRLYPWGDEMPTCQLANWGPFDGCVGDTSEVGSYPDGASPYGVMDMAGNVWEWVNDYFDPDYYSVSPIENPQGPVATPPEYAGLHPLRGGSHFYSGDWQRVTIRFIWPYELHHHEIGIRCARTP